MVIVLCPISSCTVRRYTPFITKRLANVCRRSSGVSSVSLGKTHRLLSRLGRALNLISSPPALSIQQSLYRHEHRSALVLDQEHQEFRRLGTACVPVNDMNIVGAFIEGLSLCQCYLFSTLHLHHNGALQYVNNRVLPASVWVEVEAPAVEVDRGLEVLPVAEATGGVAEPLDLRVQALGRRVGDPVAQVGEDVREVRLEHPRLLDHGLEPRVRRPEVPVAEEPAGGPDVAVLPEVRGRLLERPGAGDLERAVA